MLMQTQVLKIITLSVVLSSRWGTSNEQMFSHNYTGGIIAGLVVLGGLFIVGFIWLKSKKGKSFMKQVKLNVAPDVEQQKKYINSKLSVITNFDYETRTVKRRIPKTTVDGLDNLARVVNLYGFVEVSVEGGGDPLYNYYHHRSWYNKLYSIQDLCKFKLELHTKMLKLPEDFDIERFNKIIYIIPYDDYKETLIKMKKVYTEKIGITFDVTERLKEQDIEWIANFVRDSLVIDEVNFKQTTGRNDSPNYYLHQYLKLNGKDRWNYIEYKDYNLYYAENKVFESYYSIQ